MSFLLTDKMLKQENMHGCNSYSNEEIGEKTDQLITFEIV